jgi:hypothetical protein
MPNNYSITLVVGSGYPGHATVELRAPGQDTIYAGFGPATGGSPLSAAQYNVVAVPNGVSPVGQSSNPANEFQFVDASHYSVSSYTFGISQQQYVDALNASAQYQENHSSYNGVFEQVCTDYALFVLNGAFPNASLDSLSRVPSVLQFQLAAASKNGGYVTGNILTGDGELKNIGLPGLKPDAIPPNFAEWPEYDLRPWPTGVPLAAMGIFGVGGSGIPVTAWANPSAAPVSYLESPFTSNGNAGLTGGLLVSNAASGAIGDGNGIGSGWSDTRGLRTGLPDDLFNTGYASIGSPKDPAIDYLYPADPIAVNGLLPGNSLINTALLDTQSGQMAFPLSPTPNGLSGTTENWQAYFGQIPQNYTPTVQDPTVQAPWYSSPAVTGNYTPTDNSFSWPDPNSGNPVVLDLTGNGINITQLSSSSAFHDMTGDGYQNRTAWAGAGNGVLAIDLKGTSVIDTPEEYEFTDWDPTASSDMQALRDVFDTNHDGKLDAGDTDWSAFGVEVTNADGTTTFETLSQLGITAINLTTDNNADMLADGSEILGETTYTTAGGGTGTAADASFAYDANGYAAAQTVTRNADGSTTIDVKARNPDGSLASETVTTTIADGLSRTLQFDHTGNGLIDQTQTDVTVVHGDGSRTEAISDFDAAGALIDRTVTTTSAGGATVSIARDTDGNGSTDQTELHVTNPDGSKSITVADLNEDGSLRDRTVSTTSQDGLTKLAQTDSTGSGVFDQTRRRRQSHTPPLRFVSGSRRLGRRQRAGYWRSSPSRRGDVGGGPGPGSTASRKRLVG